MASKVNFQLIAASKSGNLERVKLAIDNGADANAKDKI